MILTAQQIIDKRFTLWQQHKSIDKDKEYRDAAADYMVSDKGKELRKEVKKNPELLIEMFFVIVNKDQETVPFVVNEVQRELQKIINDDIELYKQGKLLHLKYLLLKGRQQGFTSYIAAYQLARCIVLKNFNSYTLADNAENTEGIFTDKSKYYFDNLPDKIKPSIKYSNRRELDFSREDGKGMNIKIRVATAGNIDAGRSKTLSFFHGSECSFWPNMKRILTGLAEAFTKNCIVILETTANGFNEYKNMWDDDNNYKKLFFEWWKTSEYHLPFESSKIEKDFKAKVLSSKTYVTDDADLEGWIWYRLNWLHDLKLSWGQLYWYYHKWRDKKSTIKQEYPCTAEEAFLASGRNFFNIEVVNKRLMELKEHYKSYKPVRGYFIYKHGVSQWTGEKTIIDSSIEFIEDYELGYVTLYNRDIPKSEPFTIGADTAGDGSDWNVAYCINTNQEQVAWIRLNKDEDLFAEQMYCLGKMYNNALIAPEINFSTHVVNVLQYREYPNIYVRRNSPDAISSKLEAKYGFNTNKATRPAILAELKVLVRDRPECVNDIDNLNEMFTFIIDERSKPIAIEGEHDDTILAYAIALYAQEQQLNEIKIAADKLEGFYTDAELEDMGYSKWEIQRYHQGNPLFRR